MCHNPHGRKQTLNYSSIIVLCVDSVGLGLGEITRRHEELHSVHLDHLHTERLLEHGASLFRGEINSIGGSENNSLGVTVSYFSVSFEVCVYLIFTPCFLNLGCVLAHKINSDSNKLRFSTDIN